MGRVVYKVRVQLITKWEAEVFRVFELYKNTSLEDFHKMLKWSFHWMDDEDSYKFITKEKKKVPNYKERVTPLGELLTDVGDKIK